jgi:3-hydroxy acid dehydrogenase/malonic semialdehyde reductase
MMEKKIVLITGASSGIGEGCARKFAMNGYRLILNGRNVEKLNAVKKELLEKYGADVYLLPFDVRDRQAAHAALESLPEEWKAVDILVNNAGLVIGVDKEHEGNLDEWDIVIDTNVKALLAMTRLVVPGMVERGRGHVINMGPLPEITLIREAVCTVPARLPSRPFPTDSASTWWIPRYA